MDFWNCSCDVFKCLHIFTFGVFCPLLFLFCGFVGLISLFVSSCFGCVRVWIWVIFGYSSMEISCNHFLAKSTTWNLRGPAGWTATFWELSSSGAIDVWNSGRVSVVARRLPVLENAMYRERTVSPAMFYNESWGLSNSWCVEMASWQWVPKTQWVFLTKCWDDVTSCESVGIVDRAKTKPIQPPPKKNAAGKTSSHVCATITR